MQKLLSTLLLFILSFSLYAQEETDSIDILVKGFLKKWNIAGTSVAIAKDGRMVYCKGFGLADVSAKDSVNVNSLFRIASISKFITAVAILKLAEEGKLNLDDKVFGKTGILNSSNYKKIKDKRLYQITIKQLLQHTAGWDRQLSGDPMFIYHKDKQCFKYVETATIIKKTLRKPLDHNPGTKFGYSNFGYCLLGRVIEKVTGLSYETYVTCALFAPLGITNAYVGKNDKAGRGHNEVVYYDSNNTTTTCYGAFNLEAMDANGGWVISTPDLLKFILSADGFSSRADILNESSLKLLTKYSECNKNYALGCQVNQEGNWWHTGALPGASSLMARLSSGLTWVILLNGRPTSNNYFPELEQLMWKAIGSVKKWSSQDLFNRIL